DPADVGDLHHHLLALNARCRSTSAASSGEPDLIAGTARNPVEGNKTIGQGIALGPRRPVVAGVGRPTAFTTVSRFIVHTDVVVIDITTVYRIAGVARPTAAWFAAIPIAGGKPVLTTFQIGQGHDLRSATTTRFTTAVRSAACARSASPHPARARSRPTGTWPIATGTWPATCARSSAGA